MQLTHPQFKRITIDSEVCFGKPCIRGMRMPVSTLLAYLSSGMSYNDLLQEFSFLEKEDIMEALAFSSIMVQDTFVPLQKAS